MTLEIVESNSSSTIAKYTNYTGVVPSIGDEISIRGYDDDNDSSVKERYFWFNEDGLEHISIWVK